MNQTQFMWQDRFNIGVDIIDREHKKLFSIMNKLLTYINNEEKSEWVCKEGIKYFKGHAMKHFAEEEVYMASIDYSGYEIHRRLHDNFRKKTLPEIEKELERENYSQESVKHFLSVCAGWLIGHTLTEDRAITGKTISKWVDLLPEEQQSAVAETIIQLLYDLFQLKAKVINETYGGEKFGKGIYYRLVYGSPKGEHWEILLVFEEKLLISTINNVVNAGSDKLNVMMMNVTRYIAQQFVERIRMHFPSNETFEIQEENLLTYEQFQDVFGRQNPQCSLLFDTGEGYFAYCVIAPHLLKDVGPSINANNAVSKIRTYLNENKESGKKKILLVDDSNVILHSMEELFKKDYEITTAVSGISAIRSMVLDKPDLVLLDYMMPVCDGRQVLEMMRAEEALADIPVIFLSGKTDKESLTNLLALKPAGYLLKTLPPQEIKNSVDRFFKKKKP